MMKKAYKKYGFLLKKKEGEKWQLKKAPQNLN